MSADNWARCPKCLYDDTKAKEKQLLDAGKSYGKSTPEEYLAKLEEANKPIEYHETLREDYQIGIWQDGKFHVEYRGRCDRCGLTFSFNHEKVVSKGVEL